MNRALHLCNTRQRETTQTRTQTHKRDRQTDTHTQQDKTAEHTHTTTRNHHQIPPAYPYLTSPARPLKLMSECQTWSTDCLRHLIRSTGDYGISSRGYECHEPLTVEHLTSLHCMHDLLVPGSIKQGVPGRASGNSGSGHLCALYRLVLSSPACPR